MKKNYMKISVLSVAAVLGVWILGSALNCFNPTFIPSVKDVLDAFWNLWEAPLFIQVVFGVQKVPQDRINGARSLGAGNFVIFRDVILPSVLPDILTGLRTAVGVSYATLVAAEMIASASGLAWMVLDASKYIQYATVYAGIFIMGGIALLIDGGLKLLIRKAMPWQETI